MEEELTESGMEPIEVRVSVWKYVVEFGAMALIFLFSLFLIGIGLIERDSGFLTDLLTTVFGLMGVPLSALACSNVVEFLRDSRPALRVTEEGILNRTFWSSATIVPWDEIVDIRPTRRRWYLEMVLRDPKAYRARQTPSTRALMYLRTLLGGSPFPLFLPQLDAPREEVVRQLSDAVEAKTLGEIREEKRIEESVGQKLNA